MAVYITILLSVMFVSALGQNSAIEKPVRLGQCIEKRKIPSLLTTVIICAILIFFFAARWNVGTDYPNYFLRFGKLLAMNIPDLVGGRDWGFDVFTAFVGQYVFTNFFLYCILLGALIYIPVVLTYRRFSSDYTMTYALYILMCLYTWPYNGMRQSVAVSLLFLAFPFLYERKNWWKFIAIAAIAYTFHSTALLVIPFILICKLKPWKKPFIFVCLLIVVLIIFLPGLWTTIIDFLDSIGQSKMAEDYADFEELRAGVNFIRIVVAAVPVFLSFVFYPTLKSNNKHIDFIINMCVMNLIFLLCGNRLTIMARFATYFNVALPLLVPEFVKVFKNDSKGFARGLIYIAYFGHMLILLPNDSGLLPYRFIFGHI
ncbi:MAG: EpsG family protein [Clostridia bacterium]|nr:EpsG family protein [Clostridia bacterium]